MHYLFSLPVVGIPSKTFLNGLLYCGDYHHHLLFHHYPHFCLPESNFSPQVGHNEKKLKQLPVCGNPENSLSKKNDNFIFQMTGLVLFFLDNPDVSLSLSITLSRRVMGFCLTEQRKRAILNVLSTFIIFI
ncbi:hypothetical protein CEXT_129021 [Caerostris extrusa]|uniref:Uncharacterized protein n=1 Tax=Caerostris extrusa TaxID=172846 RepID=A0AAV4Y1R8_CAEEX|nr:hypothetical protein CEXT_129021 [Caerostris extrusa]